MFFNINVTDIFLFKICAGNTYGTSDYFYISLLLNMFIITLNLLLCFLKKLTFFQFRYIEVTI